MGVDVPDTLGVAGAAAAFGTRVVIWKDTSPEAVAIGLAEYLARSISIVLYLVISDVVGSILLSKPITK
jgi:hypothetical protein